MSTIGDADLMKELIKRAIKASLGSRLPDNFNDDDMAVSRQIVEGINAIQKAHDNKLDLATDLSIMIHHLVLEPLLHAEMDQHLGYTLFAHLF